MASERTVECPDCGAERVTRAQPRTRLRCRSCGAHYLTPPLERDIDVTSPEGDGVDLGPPVEHVESVEFPAAPVAPDGKELNGQNLEDSPIEDAQDDLTIPGDDLADPPRSPDPAPVADPAAGSSGPAEDGGPSSKPLDSPPISAERPPRRRRYGRW